MTFHPRAITEAGTQDYLAAMAQHVTSVCVVTTTHGGRFHGLTATSVSSVCATPPRLLVCVNNTAASHDPILAAGHFCVNMLAEDQQDIARRFGGMLKSGEEKFDPGLWRRMPSGVPCLAGAVAAFECRIADTARHHTHTVFFGDVLSIRCDEAREVLLYGARTFRRATPVPA